MEQIIEKAKKEYFELLAKVENINRGIKKPKLEELPEILGIKVTEWVKDDDLFDGMYGNILVTIFQIHQQEQDDIYVIGGNVEIYDENEEYVRDLTDEEISI